MALFRLALATFTSMTLLGCAAPPNIEAEKAALMEVSREWAKTAANSPQEKVLPGQR